MTQPGLQKRKALAKRRNKGSLLLAGSMALAACSTSHQDCHQLVEDQVRSNAGCLVVQGHRLLMVQQRVTGYWAVPGGTAERNERAVCVAARETEEETGLNIEVIKLMQVFDNGFHLYHCEASENQAVEVKDAIEIRQVKWMELSERTQLQWRYENQKIMINNLVKVLTTDQNN